MREQYKATHTAEFESTFRCTGLKCIGKECRSTQGIDKHWNATQGQIRAKMRSNYIKVELDGPNKPLWMEIGCE